jgi:hypothetical protein
LQADNETIVLERIDLDKVDPNLMHNDITTIDHALTRPWVVLTSSNPLSTLHRRFASARLSQPYPLGLVPTLAATLTTIAFDDSSLQWFETNT